jgi:hypothetical protein
MYFCEYNIENIYPIVILNRPHPWKISMGFNLNEYSLWAPHNKDYTFYSSGVQTPRNHFEFLIDVWLKCIT